MTFFLIGFQDGDEEPRPGPGGADREHRQAQARRNAQDSVNAVNVQAHRSRPLGVRR